MNELNKCLEEIMKRQYSKDTLDLLSYSVGYLERKFPEVSKFLDFILMADKRQNEIKLPSLDFNKVI